MSSLESFEELWIESSLDGSRELSLLHVPPRPRALLVALHTWSTDRMDQAGVMLPLCREREWALLLPEFRGPNLASNPRASQACASDAARRDIVDAARWVRHRLARSLPVFLLGGSGGGHMALMVAALEEFPWQAVSAWCPITDLAAWHGENIRYAPHIEAVCGGPPDHEQAKTEYLERSPLFFAEGLRRHRLQVAHGRHDPSVPWLHSWRLAEKLIHCPRFYFSLFDGGHELRAAEAFAFLENELLSPRRPLSH